MYDKWAFLPLQVLYTVLVQTSARVLPSSNPADQLILSPRRYQHTDHDSGVRLVCNKCPAGTYVSVHCSQAAMRECSPCPEGTFTRGENGIEQCHRCRAPCAAGFIEKVPCTPTQDRVCTCPPNSFLSGEGGSECKPHSLCPPGFRVKRRGSETEDVLCKPCTKGTFSDMGSSMMKCRTHTDCQAQGLVVLSLGTRDTDNVCGPPRVDSPTTTLLVPVQDVLVHEPMTFSSPPLSRLIGTEHKGKGYHSVSSLLQSMEWLIF